MEAKLATGDTIGKPLNNCFLFHGNRYGAPANPRATTMQLDLAEELGISVTFNGTILPGVR
jgi:hypothetical protein